MPHDKMPKKIFLTAMQGKRGRGRPRRSWAQDLENDLNILGATNWKRKAEYREQWLSVVKGVKAYPGL